MKRPRVTHHWRAGDARPRLIVGRRVNNSTVIFAIFRPIFSAIGWIGTDLIATHARFTQPTVSGLPVPLDLFKFVAFGQQFGPDLFKDSEFNPMLEDSVNFGIVSKFPGQMIPLTSAAEAMDDRIENRSPVDAGGSYSSSKILMISQRSSETSQMVGYDS
jgi:hypothetical protein